MTKRKIKICDRCKGTNVDTLVPKIKKICPDVEIQIGCQNFCGIGQTKSFLILDHIPLIASSEDELIEKLKESLSK